MAYVAEEHIDWLHSTMAPPSVPPAYSLIRCDDSSWLIYRVYTAHTIMDSWSPAPGLGHRSAGDGPQVSVCTCPFPTPNAPIAIHQGAVTARLYSLLLRHTLQKRSNVNLYQ